MKMSCLFALVILLFSYSLQAQDQQLIDSLTVLLEENQPTQEGSWDDTTRVKLLLSLSWELKFVNPDTAIILGQEALSLLSVLEGKESEEQSSSMEHALKKRVATANNNLAVFYWILADYPVSLSYHAKALSLRKQLKDRRGVAISLSNIASVYLYQGDYPKALEHYFAALEIDKELQLSKSAAQDMGNIGNLYRTQGDFANALKYFNLSLEMMKQSGSRYDVAQVLGNIGSVYAEQGDFPKALKNCFAALEVYEDLGEKMRIAIVNGNIGNIYNGQGDYMSALKYHFKALEIDRELGKRRSIIGHLGNIGAIYNIQEDYSKALKCHFEALNIAIELGIRQARQSADANIGDVYFDQAEGVQSSQDTVGSDSLYARSLKHYKEALLIAKEIGSLTGIQRELGSLGRVYRRQAESSVGEAKIQKALYLDAEQHLQEALTVADSIGLLTSVKVWHLELSELYERTQRYDLALVHFRQYSVVKDSLFNEEKSKDIGKLEAQHDFAVAVAEQKRNEAAQAQQEAAAKSRRDNLQYSGILIFLVLVFAGVFGMAKISIPIRLAEGLIFFSFLLFFEFSLVLLDPYIDRYSSGAPAIKLGFNAILAGLIFPLHSFFEMQLKGRLIKSPAA